MVGFEFVNGFHDTANAVATVIYTKALKPMVAVAGTPAAVPATQAALIPAQTVQEFLRANGVAATGSVDAKPDAKASVVRVICVRK